MMNEHLLRGILYFTRETRIMDGMAAVCGWDDFRAAACDGREIRENTLFDLASLTKVMVTRELAPALLDFTSSSLNPVIWEEITKD